MAAPIGNNNAIGNKGGGSSTNDRAHVSKFKGYVLEWLIEKMERGTNQEKKEIVMKLGANCIPRDINVGGQEENPLKVIEVICGSTESDNQSSPETV